MKLTPVFLDFETFWSATHSLTFMSPIVYCMHPETELISVSIRIGKGQTQVYIGEEAVKAAVQAINWSDKLAVAHNMSGFDALLLAFRCGVRPAMWGCTLAMARPLHNLSVGGSLSKLLDHYGLKPKDNRILLQTKGRHLKDFTAQEVEFMRTYNGEDTDGCAALFDIFLPLTSKREMKLVDMTIRMLVEPEFEVDKDLLLTTLGEERMRKKRDILALAAKIQVEDNPVFAHIQEGEYQETINEVVAQLVGKPTETLEEEVRAMLASAPKFAARLISWGVDVPTKESPTTPGKRIYALSKTDQEFLELLDHPSPLVAAAVRMRLDVKSTILESRMEAFLEVANCMKGKMPIAKNYYGAHTGRWSGSMGLNQENLPRIDVKNPLPSDALRKSLRAPRGCKVVVADLSGIELRVNHFLWKVPSSMALFQADPAKADLYKDFAGRMYEKQREDVTKAERTVGKISQLGLGFGAGAGTFKRVAKTMGRIDLSSGESEDVVSRWRGTYPEIVAGWRTCHAALDAIYHGAKMFIDPWGLCYTSAEGIHTPTGMIRYPGLHQEMSEGNPEWWYGEGRNRARIYAGKVTENIVQHLARNVLADNALRIKKELGYKPVHLVHDEWVGIAPASQAMLLLDSAQEIMRTPPTWWPELIVWSSGGVADTYGDVDK